MKITNSLSGKKEEFIPIVPGKVSMYVCGVTLYDDIHVGHLKSIVAFEVMRNFFKEQGLEVKFVRNITDIDDKIIAKAKGLNVLPLSLVNEYIEKFHALMIEMQVSPPDIEPRVTEYLEKIENYINNLQKSGRAYVSEDGVYFNTQIKKIEKYPLSKKIVKDLDNQTGLDENYDKKHKADFALWKKDESFGFNSSIFNKPGRPGWHIECSAMHYHALGEKFDIHGGGRDLIFPHHENEISQSEAHNGVNPANYWVHNGMMTKDGQKLSKSLGNSIYVKDLLKSYTPEGLKLFLNKGGYGQSQEFNDAELKEANDRWKSFARNVEAFTSDVPFTSIWTDVKHALEDDFNTPLAVVLMYQAMKEVPLTKSREQAEEILKICKILAIAANNETLESLANKNKSFVPEMVQLLMDERQSLKEAKNWAAADEKRELLKNMGWNVIDNKSGESVAIKI